MNNGVTRRWNGSLQDICRVYQLWWNQCLVSQGNSSNIRRISPHEAAFTQILSDISSCLLKHPTLLTLLLILYTDILLIVWWWLSFQRTRRNSIDSPQKLRECWQCFGLRLREQSWRKYRCFRYNSANRTRLLVFVSIANQNKSSHALILDGRGAAARVLDSGLVLVPERSQQPLWFERFGPCYAHH